MKAVKSYLKYSETKLKNQWVERQLLTTKASIILGVASILAASGAPALMESASNPIAASLHVLSLYLSYAAFALCVFFGLRALRDRDYEDGADPAKVRENYEKQGDDHHVVEQWIADANIVAVSNNARHLNDVASEISRAFMCLFATIAFRVMAFDHSSLKHLSWIRSLSRELWEAALRSLLC